MTGNNNNDTLAEETQDKKQGFLMQSLSRTNADIRRDRGNAIYEDLEVVFKRQVEDAHRKIRRIERDRDAMYDFSPNSTTSLVLSKNVKAEEIIVEDAKFTEQIRVAKIDLANAQERYTHLFGAPVPLTT